MNPGAPSSNQSFNHQNAAWPGLMARYCCICFFFGLLSFTRDWFLGYICLRDSSSSISWWLPSLLRVDIRVYTDSDSVLRLPFDIVRERYLTVAKHQLSFIRRTTLFQDLIIRCMRYAFSNIPSRITRVFFTRDIVLPFLKFRMLRHGYFKQLRRPIWREICLVSQFCLHKI